MRTIEHVLPIKSNQKVRVLRYLLDSVLACAGSLLVTAVIVVFHLYPAISNISIVYLLVVLALAITRGRYAAILSAVVAFLSLAYFIVPPLHTFGIYLVEEWIALFGLLIATMLTGHLAVALRERAEQANRRESETRQLSEVVRATSQEAEAAHARLYDFFMQAPAAMTILRGPEHRIEFANPLALRHRDQADLMGKTAREVRPELVEQGVLAILDEVYTTGTPFVGTEFPVRVDRRGDGVLEEAYYNFVYQPLRTAQGDIEGILVHSVEVTEQVLARRRVEELNRQLEAEKNALRQTEQEAQARTAELEAIFEAMTEGVIVCDARGEVRYINAAYRSLLALEEDSDPSLLQLDHRIEWLAFRDLEGRPLPKEQLPVLRVLQGECLSSTHRMDCMCRTRKGEDLILNVSGAPIRDAAGQIAGGVVVFRDVTGQRHIEQQLQYSERKLLSLVDSNIFGVVVVDIDGRFYEANERFVQMVGYSKEELLSGAVTWQQLNLPEYQEATAQAVGAVLSTGAMYPYEKEHLHKDGSRAPILIAGAMIDQKRELVLVVILDISERKAAERRKQEFLSMVSHEAGGGRNPPGGGTAGGVPAGTAHIRTVVATGESRHHRAGDRRQSAAGGAHAPDRASLASRRTGAGHRRRWPRWAGAHQLPDQCPQVRAARPGDIRASRGGGKHSAGVGTRPGTRVDAGAATAGVGALLSSGRAWAPGARRRIRTGISHRQDHHRAAPGAGGGRECSWARLHLLVYPAN